MKKSSFGSRAIALLLALVMVLSAAPLGVFAANIGDLYAGDTGIKTDTLGDQGFINWPVKIYDYLDDGLLFESAQANITDASVECKDNYKDDIKYLYGGGENAPIVEEGTDLTGNAWYGDKAPWKTISKTRPFKVTKVTPSDYTKSTATTDDDPFVNPRFLRLTRDTSVKNAETTRFPLKDFTTTTNRRSTAYIKLSAMRYMVIVYKGQGLSDENDLKIFLSKSGTDLRGGVALSDSDTWVAKVIDLRTLLGTSAYDADKSTNITSADLDIPSLDKDDVLGISHVAFFSTSFEAEQFGIRAEKFSNNPGELLTLDVSITSQTSNKYTMPMVDKPGYILSYNNRYISASTNKYTGTEKGVYFGLDLTTKNTANGMSTVGYDSSAFKNWSAGNRVSVGGSNQSFNALTVTEKSETNGQMYVNLSNGSGNTGRNRILLTTFREDTSDAPRTSSVNYAVLVYRTHGLSSSDVYGFWAASTSKRAGFVSASSWNTNSSVNPQKFVVSEDEWIYMVVDLTSTIKAKDSSNMGSISALKNVGMYLPALTNNKSIDLAYVAYFDNSMVADYFGASAAGYMNAGKVITSTSGQTVNLSNRDWSGGNNLALGLLYSSQGGTWTGGIYGSDTYTNISNGYHTWRIGYDLINGYDYSSNTTRRDIYGKKYTGYYTGKDPSSGNAAMATPGAGTTTNNIFYVSSKADDGDSKNGGFDMSKLDLDGYQLLTTLTQGGMTAGLLEGTLADGRPVYRQEAVEYVAQLLYYTLTIPQFDADGDYNYNFVAGAKNSAMGGFDLNGDGKIGMADLNGDNYAETNEAKVDVATALRGCLGIRFTLGAQRGTNPAMGSYNQTVNKKLIGQFKDVRNNITTCMDAAYFLLNTLFYDNSYNQLQNDYSYLKLDHATMDNGKTAYVFDAGYTTGSGYAEGTVIGNNATYKKNSQSAIVYDPYVNNANGTLTGTGTISMKNVNSKDLFYYSTSAKTTLNPFLPVTHAEGDFAGETSPYYFYDDGVSDLKSEMDTYINRNFNYALACNGEFVYHEKDNLFFEFEGDDDVYLFINGEIVLDLGGAHSISNESLDVNVYVEWAREVVKKVEEAGGDYAKAGYTAREYERAQKLDLIEGEICQFDFYYMERHGYGANCRIVTNMRVTDPALRTEKNAAQKNEDDQLEDIPYGGAIAFEEPIAYNFKLTNTGNTKLYNLTFEDKEIGVKLDYINGLQVTGTYQGLSVNGFYVLDKTNGELTASDLTADVVGYQFVGDGNGTYRKTDDGKYIPDSNGSYNYTTVKDITFKDNQALINFLKTLAADGTDDTLVDEEKTQQGAGLWVDASVTIKGIYYLMTDENVDVGFFDNTVYVSAATRVDPNSSGSHTLRSSANHRVYISGDPVYFQWADHDLYLNLQMILSDSTKAAGTGTGGQLSQYQEFFKAANYEIGNVNTIIADKNGNLTSYNEVKWAHTRDGVLVNYSEAGTQAFYLYMSLKNENYNGEPGIQDGEYAIIRVTVNVASVKDSVYVLDYGLRSENLDTGNELFKNDQLLGADSGTVAKLMGISTVQPYYLDYTSNQKSYNRINFESTAISSTGRIWTNTNQNDSQGCWTVKMDIPESGRQITYSAYTGGYSLTDAGTVGIHVDAPFTWDDVYLYWWYNNGVSNGAFPGQHMNRSRAGKFNLDIPADVPHLIISHPATNENGETVYLQTDDLNLVSGRDAWITIDGSTKGGTINSADHLNADVSYSTQTVNMHANVPAGWGDVYLYYRNEQGTVDENHPAWPGVQMMPNSDGSYSAIDLPGDISHIIVNDGGNNKQTDEITVFAGSEIWINVAESTNANWYVSNNSVATSTPIKISGVPADWTDVYLYYWTEGIGDHGNFWPGTKLTETDDAGNYVFDLPMNIDRVIITNNNGMQTQNLVVAPGRETTITLDAELNATMTYNAEGTFTVNAKVPAHWGDNVNLHYWDAMNNGYSEVTWPGKAMGVIHNNYTGETTYTLTIPNYATHVVINDGTNQSGDLTVVPGSTNEIGFSATYNATLLYTQEKVKIHATVPESWKEGTSGENPLIVSLYCWDNNDNKPAGTWPGTAMILEDINGTQWYTLEVPANVTNVIINNNNNGKQTADLTITEGLETWIEVNDKTNDEGKYTAAIGYGSSAGEEGFFFTPINFMDKAYYLYMAVTIHDENETPTPLGKEIDIHNELQMFKKITVLPANVVYYEDDFHGIVYDTTTGNQFSSIGEGSGSLSQSVDQKMEYGQDPYYGNGVNDAYSGDSLTKIQINNTKDVASFTFSGTGFEIIGRTNATDAGTMMVKVYDAKEYATAAQTGTTDALVPYMQVPVINEFDNGSNGGLDSIEQVPVIRISKITDASGKNLGYGAYTVVINGIPTYNFQNWDGNVDNMPLKETYLYIDGIRIFQPYNNGVSELYRPAESGASFYEVHNMILDKKVFVISTNETATIGNKTVHISGGMNTWTENRNGVDKVGNAWSGNTVSSAADYMFAGPNNEAYLAAVQSNPSALAFYVQETNSANKELQVAVRAIDYGSFFGNTSTGLNAQLQLGVITEDGSFAWVSLASVMSGTEQYYTIPYTNCPFDRANDRYQIVLRVVNGEGLDVTGMVSLTSLKTNGLTIPTLSGDQYELTYNAAGNALVNAVNGETVDTGKYVNFKMVLNQMNSNVVIDDDFLPDSIVPGTSGSDKTGFGLAGANMHLGNSLSMNFFVNKADLVGTDYYAVITRYTADGVETVTVPYEQWDDRNTMFAITLSNLAARQMTDKVAVVIYNANGTQVSQIWTDSVQDYAMRILDNSDAVTKTVLVDMLNYGAAAQIYFGYRTENLANSLLTAEQKACATQNVVCADQSVKGVNSVGSSLMLKEQIVLTQYFKNVTADMYAVVSFKDHKGNAHETRVDGSDFVVKGDLYGVDVKDLVIADGDQMVTVTVYDAQGNVVASATDSINSYCARQLGDDALFESVVKFTTSAYAFFH